MKFNIKELKNLLVSVKHNNLQSISIKKTNLELIVSKESVQLSSVLSQQIPMALDLKPPTLNKLTSKTKQRKQPSTKNKFVEPEIYFTIVSPMVGTFYRSPAPGEPHFIEVNDSVKINQTVCLVEAMKLMNEIEAEVSGEVVEILVKDGDIIDCGQALMKIKPGP